MIDMVKDVTEVEIANELRNERRGGRKENGRKEGSRGGRKGVIGERRMEECCK